MPATAPTLLSCSQGDFELSRHPRRRRETLQAWCAADLLLLEAVDKARGNTLVVNDDHGALSIPLSAQALWTDSALSAQAVADNARRNGCDPPVVFWSTQEPQGDWPQVVMRIPKQLAYFEFQLSRLARLLPQDAKLYCAGMDKHLPRQTGQLLERYFRVVERHPGQRKARLFTACQPVRDAPAADVDSHYFCAPVGHQMLSQANVFSRDGLDIGTRFLLDNLHRVAPVDQAADLACGNGVLGIAAMQQGIAGAVTFADESAMAIASARHNVQAILGNETSATFHHGDGLLECEQQFELILCNPPFHLGHTVDEFAGRRLIRQCAVALRPGGQLLLVANRHLNYAGELKRRFSRIEQTGQNRKFRLWQATRSC
ncbi:class I SAM-dependent methyltransferase [Pseudohalioglobus sediminis]|uniref:Class I SAM-dependent methyltransferase n=1 Tax=Pseudohalioglobus sediminis TaxID=2606449 RepID=A0A5B0X1H9_9GAMM|nr:class I SAM-dependent methyltransferase [Pseudohalioglobus sediminis]KAA1193122.1 class I SAM-dependent methyltransferase [Pseudohalioglobus sediminis]